MHIRGGAAIPCLDAPRPYVRVGIRDDQRIPGIGEATPWPAATPVFVEEMARVIGEAFANLGRVALDELPPLEAVLLAMSPVEASFVEMKSARFAVETALLDLVGQRLGKTLTECLSGIDRQHEISCNALLDIALDDLVIMADELRDHGYSSLKVKLRARDDDGFQREVEELRELRRVFTGELRLDPNGMWSLDEARKKLEVLAEFAPSYVEQPVPAEQLVALGRTACPWAADESLLLPGLAEQLIDTGACAAFVLKPALLGGLSRAMRLAHVAQSAGIVAVTTHALDGPVGIAAACEFARSVPGKPPACGLDLHNGLSRYPDMTSPHHVRPGVVARSNSLPGLGFTEEARHRWMA